MGGRSLTDLPSPKRRFRIEQLDSGFETAAAVASEDAHRARMMRALAGDHDDDTAWALRALAGKLDPVTSPGTSPTLASARYTRELRRNVTGALLRATKDYADKDLWRFDVIKPGWRFDTAGLHATSFGKLRNRFRRDLNLAGMDEARDGFLFAGIHGQLDTLDWRFVLHFHVLATGDYVDVLRRLRGKRAYRPTPEVARPIEGRAVWGNRPRALGYLTKTFWDLRVAEKGDGGLARKKHSKKRRIPEPYHSQHLLFLDQQPINDLVLRVNMPVATRGLSVKH